MQLEAEAERLKRKDIILSEAKKASEINVADGMKQSAILRAQGEAEVILFFENLNKLRLLQSKLRKKKKALII